MRHEERHRTLVACIEENLGPLMRAPGEVLLSGIDSLTKGDFYLMGLNPGSTNATSIIDHARRWDLVDFSAYVDQCWKRKCWWNSSFGWQEGLACEHKRRNIRSGFQSRVISLMQAAGIEESALSRVCSTNAVFASSTRGDTFEATTTMTLANAWQACWRVHLWMLSIVRPPVIVCLGFGDSHSPFAFLSRSLGIENQKIVRQESAKWFDAVVNTHGHDFRTRVIGITHPSSWFHRKTEIRGSEFAALVQRSDRRYAG